MPLPVTTPDIRRPLRVALCAGLLAMGATPLMAQTLDQNERDEIIAQLRQLREQQAQIAQMQQQTEHTIRALESRLDVVSPPLAEAASATPAPAGVLASQWSERLKVSGDLRVRMQGDYSDNDMPGRRTAQVRGRLGATYALNELVTVGARMVTGSANDPNSTDVQLSNWGNGFEISLDLAYVQLDYGNLKVYGGKIPQPFVRTDLVWDGDVNPQGVSAVYKQPLANGGAFRASALGFAIDTRAVGSDSYMGGVQLGFDSPSWGPFKFDVSAGYYDYSIGSMVGADVGDWRSNRLIDPLNPASGYLSDYRLLDVIAGLSWQGSNAKWPLRIVGDYVRNLGADDEDTGFGVDVSLGRASQAGDWRLTYGYSQTDVDAVFAAFSHDNLGIATNYKLHALTVDYTWMPKTMLSAIWYHYKPNNPLYAGSRQSDDWLDRFRVFLLVNF